jgi:hypothetical protein
MLNAYKVPSEASPGEFGRQPPLPPRNSRSLLPLARLASSIIRTLNTYEGPSEARPGGSGGYPPRNARSGRCSSLSELYRADVEQIPRLERGDTRGNVDNRDYWRPSRVFVIIIILLLFDMVCLARMNFFLGCNSPPRSSVARSARAFV